MTRTLLLLVVLPSLWAATVAPKPLFRDPVFDGAADPVLVQDAAKGDWVMFYTVRRANVTGLKGVAWVHGTPIGMARSQDGGNTWTYAGTAQIAIPGTDDGATYWAPEVLRAYGKYHMFLTVVPGVFEDWKHPRHLVHLTSDDLVHWNHSKRLELDGDKLIDACVARMDDGTWRLWYNNERDHKAIYWAESTDLQNWTLKGKAVGDRSGEGPKVFHWKGAWWMITDVWRGLGVYRSEDATTWTRQEANLLAEPGLGTDDQVKGGHADIVISGERAFLFYFTHPGRQGADANLDGPEQRRSSIQVTELFEREGLLHCERNTPTQVQLNAEAP